MWLVIAILGIIVLFLFNLALKQLNELEEKKASQQYKSLKQANIDLKKARRQEINNNTILLNNNRELQNFIDGVENIINGKRTPEEKIHKIIELFSRQRKQLKYINLKSE